MRFGWKPAAAVVLGGLLVGTAACGDDGPTDQGGTGTLQVTLEMGGVDLDPDGGVLVLDREPFQAIGVGTSLQVPNLPVGFHLLEITGIATNCTPLGQNPRNFGIRTGEITEVTVAFNCSRIGGGKGGEQPK